MRRSRKKDENPKYLQTSTPILGKLVGDKFPSFKRLSIIKAQCERDIREIQEENEKRRKKKSLFLSSGIFKDTSEQFLEARHQRIAKREESDSFTRVFYRRASIEQPSLLLGNDVSDPFRRCSKDIRFSLDDDDASSKKTKRSLGNRTTRRGGLGEKIRTSSKLGRDYYTGVLTDVGNLREEVSDPKVLRGRVSEHSGSNFGIDEGMKECKSVLRIGNKASKKKRTSRNFTSDRRRRKTRDGNPDKDASSKVVKRSSSEISRCGVEDVKPSNGIESKASEKGTSRNLNASDYKVAKEKPNDRSKDALKVIGNVCSNRTRRIEKDATDNLGKENGKIDSSRKRSNKSSEGRSDANRSTPVNKRFGRKRRGLKKKLWNDPMTVPLAFQVLEESVKINEEIIEKTNSETDASSSNGVIGFMEESNEFLPPLSRQPKNKGGIFKKPPPERLLSKVLKKNLKKNLSDDKENGPYPSTSTPLDSPVSDGNNKSVLFRGLSPVDRPSVGFQPSVNEASCVNITYSKFSAKESKLDLMWNSLLGLESNNTFVHNVVEPTDTHESLSNDDDDIRLFESPPPNLPSSRLEDSCFKNQVADTHLQRKGQRKHGDDIRLFESPPRTLPSSRVEDDSCFKDQVAETRHQRKSRRGETLERSGTSPAMKDVELEDACSVDLEELSEFKLCCESVPYTRHDHWLINEG